MAANKVVYRKTSDFNVMELGRYQILIDKRFVLVGDMESSRERHGVSSVSSTNEKTTRYIFADVSDGKTNVKKLVAIYDIQLVQSGWYYRNESSYSKYKKPHIDKGMTDCNGIRVASIVRNIKTIAPDVLKLGESKGFSPSKDIKHGVEVNFAKVIGTSRRIIICYIEGGSITSDRALTHAKTFVKLTK
jgi:hypothetical protein